MHHPGIPLDLILLPYRVLHQVPGDVSNPMSKLPLGRAPQTAGVHDQAERADSAEEQRSVRSFKEFIRRIRR